MKKINFLLALSVIFSTTTLAADCTSVGKNLNPYKGMVTTVTNLSVKEHKMDNREGLLYQWKYRFSNDRPTHSTWTFVENGKLNTPDFKDGDVFLFLEVKSPSLKEIYEEKGVKGYYPAVLTGEECQLISVDISGSEDEISW